jgi:hypothetical protein
MFTKFMKYLSITALFVGALLGSSAGYRVILELLVCVSALMVVAQAVRIGKYFWGIAFAAIALLFNPAVPVALSQKVYLLSDLVCIGAFLGSLTALRWPRALPVPAITGRSIGRESL